ncbi:hypothetical protein BMR1_03g02900 [Babesia microti strain RI]|uniref:Uncharacterized protein n=1 Tax=Babesia microti (strain RI) TaxID=1133968 RepID=A0A1R4ABZ5_BABMR|nr:hypothetical protein BMR1_03g02900 [Babesia microti strain RI]SJK86518.1 hypothetical protein BMR1_03g02900 [Babesia microti strain RI]|eukprot:XP_021338668.1 hypothetical protein BMR1_03g02900 [Babesia microti strain RI]
MGSISTFGNDCSEFCKTQHSGKGTTIYNSSIPSPVRYSVDDINYFSCKHRCRMADVIRPKQAEEKMYI